MIIKLELENYIPLTVTGIRKISMTLGEVINLLVSLNGSGKSRLLAQMNPLPAENSDFDNGRKYIEILLDKNLYQLLSVTGKQGYHSFKINNGPELNTGGTVTIQKKLVQQHFNLNTNLVKVLTGIKGGDVFSNLSTNRRKDIFMELYPNDVTYAVGVYNKLKAERNNLKGAIKNQRKNLAEESDKLFRLAELEYEGDLQERIDNLEDTIKEGLLISGNLSQYSVDPEKEEVFTQFQQLVKKLTLTQLSMDVKHSPDALKVLIENSKDSILNFTRLKDQNAALLAECECQIAELGEGKVVDPMTFREHLDSVNNEITRTLETVVQQTSIYKQLPYFSTVPINEGLFTITDDFVSYLLRVVDCSTPNLTSAVYQTKCERKEQLLGFISKHEREEENIRHRLKHIQNMDDLVCPECTHTFKQGITKQDVGALEHRLGTIQRELTVWNKELVEVTDLIESEADWYYSMKQLSIYIRENGHVKGLAELIKHYNVGKFKSTLGKDMLINALNTHKELFKATTTLSSLEEEKGVLTNRLELLNKVNEEGLFKKLKEFEELFLFYTEALNNVKVKLDQYTEELNNGIEFSQRLDILTVLKDRVLSIIENECQVNLKQRLDNKLDGMSKEKNQLMRDMIRKASLKTVVEKIEENLTLLERRYEGVTLLMEGLCPNKGLIGRLMADFIKTVCGNMNALIKELWNGTLYIKPCAKENGDLTYKFPVVNGHNSETTDVEDCSDGQCDIINFAFRHVMLKYQGGVLPLVMDEVGVKFDEINRGRFFNYINQYVNSGDCKQLFMISHYVNQYESFKNANLISLKHDGLTIHGQINRNTVIN